MFKTTYKATLTGNQLEWNEDAPRTDRPVQVDVTIVDPFEHETPEERRARGERMAAALERLAASGAFKEITDPVAWQREIRKDRPLYGREEED